MSNFDRFRSITAFPPLISWGYGAIQVSARMRERKAPRLAVFGDYDWPERRPSWFASSPSGPSPAAGNAEAPKERYTKRPRELGPSVGNILVLFREIDAATKLLTY